MKTVCFFNSTKVWGGGEKWHYETAVALKEKGYKIIFFTGKNSELYKKISKTSIKVIPVKITNFSFLNIFKIILLKKKLIENKIDIIIMNMPADLKTAGFASKLAGVKKIVYRRGSAVPVKNSISNRYIFKNILTDIIANTEATKKTILQNNNKLFDKDKIKVIYNGINLSEFDNSFSGLIKKKQTDKIIIGNIGRLVPQKAQEHLIELAVILKKTLPNFVIKIGGTGKLENELKEKAKQLKVEKYIDFIGFVENPKQFLEQIDIFVLTSKWEGFGYVIVEAGACRKPVVAYNISSNPEIVSNNKTGFLVDFYDLKAMSEKIILLSENKELREKTGNAGRKQAENKFNLTKTLTSVTEFIDKK